MRNAGEPKHAIIVAERRGVGLIRGSWRQLDDQRVRAVERVDHRPVVGPIGIVGGAAGNRGPALGRR